MKFIAAFTSVVAFSATAAMACPAHKDGHMSSVETVSPTVVTDASTSAPAPTTATN